MRSRYFSEKRARIYCLLHGCERIARASPTGRILSQDAVGDHDENITFEQAGALVGPTVAEEARRLSLRLYATARVEGDITHAQLAIEAGAHFEGRSMKFETPAMVEPLAISAAG